MKTLGIIGGIGPESTVAYYRTAIAAYEARNLEPTLVINSISVKRMLALVEAGDLPGLIEYLSAEIHRLADAGVDLALIAANTPHLVFDELSSRSSVPLVSVVDAACDAASARGLKRLALLGTRYTMQGRFFPEMFSRSGIELVCPKEEEQAFIHEKYMTELLNGIFLPTTRQQLLAIMARLRLEEHVQGVLLAGTELPLILHAETHAGIPLLDTTKIHVEYAMRRLLSH